MEKILSPLTQQPTVVKVEDFSVAQTISQYEEIGVDVKRFFENLNTVQLYKCTKTNYRFYHPFSIIGDADFYKDLSINRKSYYSTRWEHNKILSTLNPKEKVLEIGSGFGAFLSLLKSKSIQAEGLELNPEAIKKCQLEGLQIHDMLIDEFTVNHKDSHDVVCFFQVLEHITNVHDFLQSALVALKPNGKLIIGVPNNNPYLFVNDKYHTLNLPPHHAGLWNEKSLKALEKVFSVKLETVYYEPLGRSYTAFLTAYIKNSSFIYSKMLIAVNKIAPKVLKRILCKFINGRNIVVVFRKIKNG
ncbi:class I SAM-dependent methyltransferase [Lacinutrix iliipiscaria]|uniref:Class I SAM-dependent methyltransferase n=1 Tax=Lacinutrix iliipiscaria TaxID=1230532 RepID=A0ABW5WQ60_9FLAO